MKRSLFIFRRDLRLQDNTALIKALRNSDEVICCFIFNPKQLENNNYRSENLIQFMVSSLEEVDYNLSNFGSKLFLFYGELLEVLEKIKAEVDFSQIYINRDYTPFSIQRDNEIKKWCSQASVKLNSCEDYLLNKPEDSMKENGEPYTVFTPFYRNAINFPVENIQKNEFENYFKGRLSFQFDIHKLEFSRNEDIAMRGGRGEALDLIEDLKSKILNYKELRDFPFENSTSLLSAHNKMGTISIREVYYLIKDLPGSEPFIRQLYWRDFFTCIAFNFPKVFGKSFNEKYDKVIWSLDTNKFGKWCEGKTGFPIIDAAMRELNSTGYMHNRCRMIVASFLTKDLHIDWRLGEKYFAQKLVDYDPCVNNGSWQWAASIGCDAQPYFRVFNPWLQQKKFDMKCEYIKKWIPELSNLTPKSIHNLDKVRPLIIGDYPRPIIDHPKEREIAINRFKLN